MTESEEGDSTAGDGDEVAIVLAAVDTSALAPQIIEFAARMTRRTWTSAQLHLLHVFRSASFDRPSSVGLRYEDLVADARSYLEYHLRIARKQCPAPVFGHFAEGDPVDEIVKCARTISADLLIIGTRDTAGLERLLLGSVAVKVARRAPCSVVTIRRKQRPFTKVP